MEGLVQHRCYTRDVPTKRRRHAITETPPVEEALNELREELDGERIDMAELVILGAREKLAQSRAEEGRKAGLRSQLAHRIRTGQMIPMDLEAAEQAKEQGWNHEPAP